MVADGVRVFHLITELDIGGAQSALLGLLARLNRDRYHPSVACLYNGDGVMARRIRALDIPVTDLGMESKWRLDALLRLYRSLRYVRPTILHAWMFHANVIGRIVGRLAQVPIVITSRRNLDIGGRHREMLHRLTRRLDDCTIAVSELVRQAYIERAGVPEDHVITIYNGVDVERFPLREASTSARVRTEFGIPLDAPLIGAVGRLHRQKDFASLLAALAKVRLHFRAVRLLLVGEGELRGGLEELAESLGLVDAVTFAGSRSNVAEILAALDVFVLPSLWEGMPNSVMEAMSVGLPVVATAVGGTTEVVVDGQTGILVPPQEPAQLAEAIIRVLRDAEFACELGRMGRERVTSQFQISETVRRTEALYEQLLARKARLASAVAER
jgi:sugar transferase (PEP-CTERM/EpsH1 system associated)